MISIRDLKKVYGRTQALSIAQLEIGNGEMFGLVGNNGAGKTTMFRLILDLIEATEGEVLIRSMPVQRQEDWKMITGSYLDEGFLIDYLSPSEYFSFVGGLHSWTADDYSRFYLSLEGFCPDDMLQGKKPIRSLSQGNKNKIGIIAALIGDPQLLVLDEPFAHLDPSSQIILKRLLKKINADRGTTMLISSHDLTHVTEICNRIVLLEEGLILKDLHTAGGTLGELEAYFSR
ncbi:MAG: ABC transporter ATP-binding protein [Bacteroidetes bacterium]|nr:ABC transporter ATP-binding protein [Bacteroidota bacterium]